MLGLVGGRYVRSFEGALRFSRYDDAVEVSYIAGWVTGQELSVFDGVGLGRVESGLFDGES